MNIIIVRNVLRKWIVKFRKTIKSNAAMSWPRVVHASRDALARSNVYYLEMTTELRNNDDMTLDVSDFITASSFGRQQTFFLI